VDRIYAGGQKIATELEYRGRGTEGLQRGDLESLKRLGVEKARDRERLTTPFDQRSVKPTKGGHRPAKKNGRGIGTPPWESQGERLQKRTKEVGGVGKRTDHE